MTETFEHPADIGIRGIGKNVREAFAEAARCMFSVMADLDAFGKKITVRLQCQAPSREELLVEFLNELLTQAAVRQCIFSEFSVLEIREEKNSVALEATARGEKIKGQNAKHLRLEVKGATYFQLKVFQKGGKTVAQCVVDV